MKQKIKKIIPKKLLGQYHKSLAVGSKIVYGNPSEKMIVIGVTGTNGKSTTVMMIARILEEAGYIVGATSTAWFKIGSKEWLNDKKMTMLGRNELQKMLHDMVKAGCQYAIVETSSEGIAQHRHLGINYDISVFTNLTPEHIESHGSFENYKKAKEQLFAKLKHDRHKKINGQIIDKVIVANTDDEYIKDFMKYEADARYGYGVKGKSRDGELKAKVEADNISFNDNGITFEVYDSKVSLKLLGLFNVYNALAAITVGQSQGIDISACRKALEKIESIPGRMEFINEGQNFKVLVDYAPEPESLRQLYDCVRQHNLVDNEHKIIHVLGSCGGGRDRDRRPVLGRLAASHADYVVVTNEDPYDDDPQEIIDEVAGGANDGGKEINRDLFKILDRREAIKKAISLASEKDLILLTGKGCEQAIVGPNNQKTFWDERQVARELLNG
ncbi:UDP-N-acetylmuramoyl-L-alanyl-D-glutamate--2,6-diaminopimelate ligase [Candidatus Falkowbacteria bacterium]|uniref:UDP-N-acetylmuramoyl-L-alanyl-D-glutamate--2, 6-diaminopimelate ligase n=1 Tax=Candidatus Buchananbacteria bacterium CG10_big_fil_rev_8_21_14_0_10_33_19 TaxID=1974525 RepID=A0A2H0W4N6_9BACT|nr:UDP-N-acetylmuramoyl-L-alanyl-D-glutamate--2,6-diaminopimelate ligase [Candidatus Falkowbacteria bacterium]PIS06322.1 MAG: UDP-N-acetylmuramoyl-L-alanyl-D-glutamate--2,6-diaminopimelate ligase [Candidatus Buchananbacteria bacterium CG10_big_fil_rev_8_21_14_0_10_33_19]